MTTDRAQLHRVADETLELVRAVSPSFADKDRVVQGAALADLLAMWLAGHVIRGDEKASKRLRKQMLRLHILAVKSLIEVNYKQTIEPELRRRTQ